METNYKTAGAVTPVKNPKSSRSKVSEPAKDSENANPNVSSPGPKKFSKSPLTKSASKAQKFVSKNPNPNPKIRERKFVIAKKSTKREGLNNLGNVVCKCSKGDGKSSKCLCVAYENLRASQEGFFKACSEVNDEIDIEELKKIQEGEEKTQGLIQNPDTKIGCEERVRNDVDDGNVGTNIEGLTERRISMTKRGRDKLLDEAKECVPEPGSGRVMNLVKAFENLLSIPKANDSEEKDVKEIQDTKNRMKWALPGLHQPPKAPETEVSSSAFSPSDFFLTSESLGLDSRRTSSLDSSRGSISSRTSGGSQRSRRNSAESSGTFARRKWRRRQLKATSHRPFKLRTEERGKCKEEEFMKKVQQMMEEEEKMRIPIAQGLPWTTDEPQCLLKPPVKESTIPVDVVLHSDVRAVERSEFDQQVTEKMALIEQYRMERERQQKLAEEEEIRRLKKELVPKAQPMPYFDRPFIPKRSTKHPTIPREPKFHIPEHKKIKCVLEASDMCTYGSSKGR